MLLRLDYKSLVTIALLSTAAFQPAWAGSSAWEETDGGRIRIVTETWRDGMESLRGALQVELAPGWKTYWREPGSAGIPPAIDVAGAATDVSIHFPIPHWVDDPYGSWAGYTAPVTLPLTFDLAAGGEPAISASIFLGICKEVCVPVTAELDIPLASSSGAALQTIQVDAAFAGLPDGNSEALSIGQPEWTADGMLEVRLDHSAGGDEDAQLFISAGADRPFGKPMPVSSGDGTTVFHAEPLFDAGAAGPLDLVIAARRGADAVEIEATMPAS